MIVSFIELYRACDLMENAIVNIKREKIWIPCIPKHYFFKEFKLKQKKKDPLFIVKMFEIL